MIQTEIQTDMIQTEIQTDMIQTEIKSESVISYIRFMSNQYCRISGEYDPLEKYEYIDELYDDELDLEQWYNTY